MLSLSLSNTTRFSVFCWSHCHYSEFFTFIIPCWYHLCIFQEIKKLDPYQSRSHDCAVVQIHPLDCWFLVAAPSRPSLTIQIFRFPSESYLFVAKKKRKEKTNWTLTIVFHEREWLGAVGYKRRREKSWPIGLRVRTCEATDPSCRSTKATDLWLLYCSICWAHPLP